MKEKAIILIGVFFGGGFLVYGLLTLGPFLSKLFGG
jgi:hypothetical protein